MGQIAVKKPQPYSQSWVLCALLIDGDIAWKCDGIKEVYMVLWRYERGEISRKFIFCFGGCNSSHFSSRNSITILKNLLRMVVHPKLKIEGLWT